MTCAVIDKVPNIQKEARIPSVQLRPEKTSLITSEKESDVHQPTGPCISASGIMSKASLARGG